MFHWETAIDAIMVALDAPEQSQQVNQLISVIEHFRGPSQLVIKTGTGLVTIALPDILLFDIQDGVLTIKTVKKTFETKMTLRQVVENLPDNFVRISRNTVINIDHLQQIKRSYAGNYAGFMTNDNQVIISRRAVKTLKIALQEGTL